MTAKSDAYDEALDRAHAHARAWLDSMSDRRIPPQLSADELAASFGSALPDGATDAAAVVDELASLAEPGLMAMPSGRFFGWVIGGALPAALAADWLTSAWDQNAGMRFATPAAAAAEEAAADWLLDLLGLPPGCDVGFVTGGTMANFTCLLAGRQQVLTDAGWDVNTLGLSGAPRIRVLAGAQRHDSVDLALRYLGLGAPTLVAADAQGRIELGPLGDALASGSGPTILCLQAGNLHSGAFDDIAAASALAHEYGAWVHVDGAFGLWAAASPSLRDHLAGYDAADSWGTDAHKTLNVPYDCGLAIVSRPAALRSAAGIRASYLVHAEGGSA
ncbi:MAG: hypothetical protein QOG49_653, partial [Frankiaceae bacterium]|nr:hypothetical protein [Frankiaceae bacterium]